MAKIEKLQTKSPTPDDIARWQRKKYSHEEIFILFLVEAWQPETWTMKNQMPISCGFGFLWRSSQQGQIFWHKNMDKVDRALERFGR